MERRDRDPRLLEKGLQGGDVRGLDIDQELIGGPGRQPLLPGGEQVHPHHRQEQQGQDTKSQAGDMQHGAGGAPRQSGQAQAPDAAHPPRQPTGQAHQQQHADGQAGDGPGDPEQEPAGETCVLGLPQGQDGQGQNGRPNRGQGRAAGGAQVPTQDPQRGYLGQLQQGRQGEAQQGDEPGGDPSQGRRQGGGRQIDREPVAQDQPQPGLTRPTHQATHQAGEQAEEDQAQDEDPPQQVMGRPQAAQDGNGVGLASDEAPAGQGDGRPGHQQGDQGRQVQEAPGPLYRGGELRPGIGTVDQADIGRQGFDLTLEAGQRPGVTGHQQAVLGAAGRRDQAGCRQVGQVHHHPRGEGEQGAGPVRLLPQDGAQGGM